MTALYTLGNSLYVNVTNKCPCACVFCIRNNGDEIKDSGSLWFEGAEPSAEEIIAEFDKFDLSQFDSVVFCGYGEPLERIDVVCKVAEFLRGITKLPIRLNTNGLSDLINGEEHTAYKLEGLIDTVSISLNAPDAESYQKVTNSSFGEKSFQAMLDFASDCKDFADVVFTVVDVIDKEQIQRCSQIADTMGIPLRVREYIEQY